MNSGTYTTARQLPGDCSRSLSQNAANEFGSSPHTSWMQGRSATTSRCVCEGNSMVKTIEIPKFANEEEEANWWASREGRAFLKQKAATPKKSAKGSRLVTQLNKTPSVQIALRLPEPD